MTNQYLYYCRQKKSYAPDITLLYLSPIQQSLPFTSGQYIEVVLSSGDLLCLSIANVPALDGHLEIHLRHNSAYPLAMQFMKEISHNKPIMVRGPMGECTLKRAQKSTLLFLAGGTGIAPMKALIAEALYQSQVPRRLLLYWGIRHPQDAYELTLLQQWQQAFPHFCYQVVLSEPEAFPNWEGKTGLVHETVAKQHPCFEPFVVFASGPFEMVRQAQDLFLRQGLLPHHFISDMGS